MITAENARELQRKGVEARRLAKLAQEADAATRKIAEIQPVITDTYTAAKLLRVRKQLERLDDLLDEECDPQKLDRLASAIARLSELERLHAGRPLPGSYRPQQERGGRSKGRPVEVWSDETPQQVVSSVPSTVPVQPPSTPPVHGPENG